MIDVSHLHKRYGSVEAVRDLSFRVPQGRVVGFLGPNGAGKSTTLRILAGFLGATKGEVRIGGYDIVRDRERAVSLLGYMPETSPLYPEMRVGEYLRFRAELKRVKRSDRRAEVERVLERAKVRDMEDVLIDHLSKGYRQRVGLADALIGSPPLLILDEPTAGLDPNQIRDVRALIRGLADDHTVLLSTHILPEVEATCDEAIVIHRGELVATGPIAELRAGAGSSRLELVVSGDAVHAIDELEALEVVAGVQASERAPDGTTALVLQLEVSHTEVGEATERIVRTLSSAEVPLRRVAAVSASLEDVFSELTAQRPRAAGDGPSRNADKAEAKKRRRPSKASRARADRAKADTRGSKPAAGGDDEERA
jgi:ABC-2 type transport system ATP-binding protein